jgi:diaminopimelate epimerase
MGDRLPVFKMNGIGNRIAVVDLRAHLRAGGTPFTDADARTLAAPARGLGFDQLMALHPAKGDADVALSIYNSDGSPAGACGNGMRCVADVLFAATGAERLVAETTAGALAMTRGPLPDTYTVDMGPARFGWADVPLAHAVADTGTVDVPLGGDDAALLGPAACASMGNPHAVFWVTDPQAIDLSRLGPLIENHPLFPDRVNVSFVRVDGPDAVTARVWERGAGATLACGSAACAIAALAARSGRTGPQVRVTLPGGSLDIEVRAGDGHILMTGLVETEAVGTIDRATLTVELGRAAA